jgi:hypothetical protein
MLYDENHMEASVEPQFEGTLLFTDEQKAKLQENGIASCDAVMLDGNTPDHIPVVKWFHPSMAATWLISELEMERVEDGDEQQKNYIPTGRAYGLCDLGMQSPEIGYVSVAEILEVGRNGRLGIERDCYLTLDKPLSEYANRARKEGRIIA